MRILMIASEAVPFAKTGGLADVVGSLPAALQSLGHEVAVLLPRYGGIALTDARRVYDTLPVWLGHTRYDTSLYMIAREVPFYLVECPRLYDRAGFYGENNGEDYPDNHVRFAVLARAALGLSRYIFRPDIVHCHDWQAGLVPVYLRSIFANDPTFIEIKTLFTIHNLGYQGLFPKKALAQVGLDETVFHMNGLEFFSKVSLIKGGLMYSDALNTVSPTYAKEIQTPECGFGLDGVLRSRKDVLTGILNGADYRRWSPEIDPYIAANYSAADLSGKRICKHDLLREFSLPPEALDRSLIGVVSRITSQKGSDLIADIAPQIAAADMSLVVLGEGDTEHATLFRNMAADDPGHIAVRIGYDEALAHKIEAGADMFLMPSRYEPSGLTQIYSLRYGTVPVVRATGGLDDTIEESTGFKFVDFSGPALWAAIQAAQEAFANPERWETMMRRGMAKDFSWRISAGAYSSLYGRLTGKA